MYETGHQLDDGEDPHTAESLDSLIAALASQDPTTCQRARHTLVRMGEGAVSTLLNALQDGRDRVRWEAAKALVEIASPTAAPGLMATLCDEESGVRWLAAEALIALGPACLEPVLQGLVDHSDSLFVREGVHHVLHELDGGPLAELVLPVLAALDGPAPEYRAAVAAYESLCILRSAGRYISDNPGATEACEDRNRGRSK